MQVTLLAWMSFVVFVLPRKELATRLGVAVTLFLALAAVQVGCIPCAYKIGLILLSHWHPQCESAAFWQPVPPTQLTCNAILHPSYAPCSTVCGDRRPTQLQLHPAHAAGALQHCVMKNTSLDRPVPAQLCTACGWAQGAPTAAVLLWCAGKLACSCTAEENALPSFPLCPTQQILCTYSLLLIMAIEAIVASTFSARLPLRLSACNACRRLCVVPVRATPTHATVPDPHCAFPARRLKCCSFSHSHPQVCMIETYKERQQDAEKQREARRRYLARCRAVQELERQVGAGCRFVRLSSMHTCLPSDGTLPCHARNSAAICLLLSAAAASGLPGRVVRHIAIYGNWPLVPGGGAAAAPKGPGRRWRPGSRCRRRRRSACSATCTRGSRPRST